MRSFVMFYSGNFQWDFTKTTGTRVPTADNGYYYTDSQSHKKNQAFKIPHFLLILSTIPRPLNRLFHNDGPFKSHNKTIASWIFA